MEFGIIAEGISDCAVIQNILLGLFEDLDDEDIRFLRPELQMDNTDKATHEMNVDQFSNWTIVKQECQEQFKIASFLDNQIEGEKYLILQIDTAECEEVGYDIARPKKGKQYCGELRNLVIDKVNEWLDGNWEDEIFYAICIEETEAWVYTLYEQKDTSKSLKAKEAFNRFLSKLLKKDKNFARKFSALKNKPENAKADFLSEGFRKAKHIRKAVKNNKSLADFVDSFSILQTEDDN